MPLENFVEPLGAELRTDSEQAALCFAVDADEDHEFEHLKEGSAKDTPRKQKARPKTETDPAFLAHAVPRVWKILIEALFECDSKHKKSKIAATSEAQIES